MKVSTNGVKRTWRIIDIIKWGESYFKRKDFDNPKQEIEWLLCDLLGLKRIDLYIKFEDKINDVNLNKLKSFKEILLHPNYIEKNKLLMILFIPDKVFNKIINLR